MVSITKLERTAYPRWELFELVRYDAKEIYEFCNNKLAGSCASWLVSCSDDDSIGVFVIGDDCGDPKRRRFRISYRDEELGARCDCGSNCISCEYDYGAYLDINGDDIDGLVELLKID